jgi:acetylornithine aminotransferase
MMIGIEFYDSVAPIRQALLKDYHIFTGVAGTNMVRILAPLCLTTEQADRFLSALKDLL